MCRVALTLVVAALCQNATIDPATSENESLRASQSISSGEFELTWIVHATKRLPQETKVHYKLYFSRDIVRFDTRRVSSGTTIGEKHLDLVSNDGYSVERLVVHGDRILSYSPDQYADGSKRAVSILSAEKSHFPLFTVYDPRLLGCAPVSFGHLHAETHDSFLGRSDRFDITAESEMLNGAPTIKLEWKRDGGMVQRGWIATDRGSRLIRAETQCLFRGAPLLDRMDSDLALDQASAVWFPRRIEFTRTVDGELRTLEVLEIQNARFNHTVDESIFTLEGLDITPGTEIFDDTTDGPPLQKIWNGKAVVAGGVRRTLPKQESVRAMPLVIGINAAVAAIVLFFYYLKRRRHRIKSV